MAVIEAEPVRGHQRARLAHVGAKHLPQGGVEQMGAAVVAGGVLASPGSTRASTWSPRDMSPSSTTPQVHDQPGHGT